MPILKNISKKVKDTFQNDKAEYYKIKKYNILLFFRELQVI